MSCALGRLSWTDTLDQEKEGSRAARGTAPSLPQPPGPGQGPPSPVCSKPPSNRGQPEVKLTPAPRCGCKVQSKSLGPRLQGKRPPPAGGRGGRLRSASPARGLGLLITNPCASCVGGRLLGARPSSTKSCGAASRASGRTSKDRPGAAGQPQPLPAPGSDGQ